MVEARCVAADTAASTGASVVAGVSPAIEFRQN